MTTNNITASRNLPSGLSSTRLTLKVEGSYFPIDKFQKLLQNFSIILAELDKDISSTDRVGVEWSISKVQQGGIVITAEANILDDRVEPERPQEIIHRFRAGLELLKETPQRPSHFTGIALESVKNISDLIDPNDFAEIKFFADDWRLNVTKNISVNIDEITKNFYQIYGSIEGELVSIGITNSKKIGIRNVTDGKIVRCFFQDELLEDARAALGKRVYVFGLIRQYLQGEKINIQVEELKVFPPKNESSSLSNILKLIRG